MEEMKAPRAPIAMFVYNRLDNLQRTVGCLARDPLARETPLYVFSDGGKDAKSWEGVNRVRRYIRSLPPFTLGLTLVERAENIYLERNITEGIAQVLARHGAVIVLEDDVCVSPFFLRYMNDALEFYRDCEKVMHISGFTNLDVPERGDVYFTRHMAGWGWATWADRWTGHFRHYGTREEALQGTTPEMLDRIEYGGNFHCLQSLDRDPIPWDICWELAIYKAGGLCLSPTQTLVRNCGISGGTHFSGKAIFGRYEYDRPFVSRRIDVRREPVEADPEVEERLNPEALRDHGFRYNLLGKAARFLYRKLVPR